MTPEEALQQFQQVTGLRVFAVLDRDGTAWWAKAETETLTFECTIGDRFLHIDELAPGGTAPYPARCVASKHIPTTGATCSVCGAAGMQHEDDHPGGES